MGEITFKFEESTPQEVVRFVQDGKVFWMGREVESDAEFRAAIIDLNKRLKDIAPRQLVDLTDDEIQNLRHKIDWTAEWSYVNFARDVISAYKEKNNV